MVGDTALLALAVYRYALDTVAADGLPPVLPPVLVREEAMYGTGFFPTERSNIYALAGRRAVSHRHVGGRARRLAHGRDPRRGCRCVTPATRRTSAARRARPARTRAACSACTNSTRSRCSSTASRRRPRDEHEHLLAIEERILQGLELPYRVVNVAAGDLGAPAAKKYDCEGWFAAQRRYRELTSTSNTTDFQARRLGIRHRADGKSLEPVHTLNGTAVTDRAVLAILENFQGDVPEVLRQYGAPAQVSRD